MVLIDTTRNQDEEDEPDDAIFFDEKENDVEGEFQERENKQGKTLIKNSVLYQWNILANALAEFTKRFLS